MSQYSHLSTPSAEWAKVAVNIPHGKPLTSLLDFRKNVQNVFDTFLVKDGATDGVKVVEKSIPGDGGEIRARIYIPIGKMDLQSGEGEGYPLMFWIYGGSWVSGKIENEDTHLRNTAVNCKIVCVCIDFRKPPENPYPAGLDDCYTAFKWALENGSELSINPSKGVIVGGQSSGANIAAGMVYRCGRRKEEGVIVTGQILLAASLIMPQSYPDKFKSELLSMDEDPDPHFVQRCNLVICTEAYHQGINHTHPEVSPLLAEPESLNLAPPTYLQICGLDPLQDEGFLYEKLLRDAGVKTKLDVYDGCPHGFYLFFRDFEATKKQRKDFEDGLQWLLASGKY